MTGPVTHFLFGASCGAAIAALALVFRRRRVLYLPAFVLACGFWGEMPYLLGFGRTSHWLANVFFGYAWLHPWVRGRELFGFVFVVALANVMLLGYVVYLTSYFWTADTVRWEQTGEGPGSRRPRRHRPRRPHRAEAAPGTPREKPGTGP